MTEEQLRQRLRSIAARLVQGPGWELSENIADWDSHLHVLAIDAIEVEYRVAFSSQEVLGMSTIGKLHAALQSKLAERKLDGTDE